MAEEVFLYMSLINTDHENFWGWLRKFSAGSTVVSGRLRLPIPERDWVQRDCCIGIVSQRLGAESCGLGAESCLLELPLPGPAGTGNLCAAPWYVCLLWCLQLPEPEQPGQLNHVLPHSLLWPPGRAKGHHQLQAKTLQSLPL